MPETFNDFEQFLFLVTGKNLFKIAHHVHENIYMFFYRWLECHGSHQIFLIRGEKIVRDKCPGRGDNASELPVMLLAVSSQDQLMSGMEGNQAVDGKFG